MILAGTVSGQRSEFQFRHITERDGLGNHTVNFLLRDRKGGMWMCSNNGLVYYDGAHFTEFKHSRDTNTIINNVVQSVAEDRDGNIWGATQNGIFCYLRREQRFRNYHMPPAMERNAWNLVCDSNGTIWANGWHGLARFDPQARRFDTVAFYQATPAGPERLEMSRNCLLDDPSGQGLWLATRKGLKYYHKATGRIDDAWSHPGHHLFNRHRITALTRTSARRFWCFDNVTKELVCFDPHTRQVLQRIGLGQYLPNAIGLAIFESSDGKLWFSNAYNEVVVVDLRRNNRLERLVADPADPFAIAGNIFLTAMEDADGTVWLCTSGGISKWYGTRSLFRIHRLRELIPVLRGNTHIAQVANDTADGSWWLTTTALQVIHYHPSDARFRVYDLRQMRAAGWDPQFGNINYVRLLDGQVLVCTTQGTFTLHKASGTMKPYRPLPKPFTSFTTVDVVSADNIHFYHSSGSQVVLFNKARGQATLLPNLSARTVGAGPGSAFMNARPGQPMWMFAGNGWIVSYRNGKMDSACVVSDPLNESHGYINWMDIDGQGNVWLAFNGIGLYRYNPSTRTTTRYTEAEGMRDDAVAVAIADQNGNIWSGDRHKYSVLNPTTGYFYNFTLPLYQQNASWYLKMMLLKNGHVAAGAFQDVVEFFPDRLLQKPLIHTPVIGSILVGGKVRMLPGDEPLRLDPEDNSLVIRFGLMTDRELFPYVMRWKLDAVDNDWQQGTDRTEAVYNKLPPGDYIFRVQAIANNREWATPEQILRIHIGKLFYQTLWFRLLVLLFIAGMLYLVYRYRLQQQRQILTLETKAESLEKEKAMIQYESLKQHLNPHFLFNSLTSLRSLIKTDSKTAAWFLDALSKVYRYVLKSADQELVLLQDEVEFVRTFAELQKVRFGEGLQVEIQVPPETGQRHIAPVVLQNLVENAIKHNTTATDSPLVINIFISNGHLVVRNNLQRYRVVETSNKQGLLSLQKLYSFYTDQPIIIEEDAQCFTVRIPLL